MLQNTSLICIRFLMHQQMLQRSQHEGCTIDLILSRHLHILALIVGHYMHVMLLQDNKVLLEASLEHHQSYSQCACSRWILSHHRHQAKYHHHHHYHHYHHHHHHLFSINQRVNFYQPSSSQQKCLYLRFLFINQLNMLFA